ncbi:MAG TPA: substrate-binding domain-containing protein [Thermoproteota archaeon]|nr:substrate-binding domain-containing protein [Thermoproteota archaeon]
MRTKPLSAAFEVWLEVDGEYVLGDKEAEILEGVQRLGSLVATARALGVSYAHAWESMSHLSEALGAPIIEARKGGVSGGGAKLTPSGVAALDAYRRLEQKAATALSIAGKRRRTHTTFGPKPVIPDLMVIGSDCIGVRILLDFMLRARKFSYEYVAVGSSAGLAAIMLGEADIAGVHLLDEETHEFNIPFLKRYWLDRKAVLIRGYERSQGLIVAKGNPKRIMSVSDIADGRVRFINRTLGSGTRTLFDMLLSDVARQRGETFSEVSALVKGYGTEVRTHEEVARAVAEGKADAGFGILPAASQKGIGFVEIMKEKFDFVVDETRLRKPLVKLFLKVLSSEEFSHELRLKAPGLVTTPETGKMIYKPRQ